MGIGVWQLVLILLIVVVIFGLGKFPKMAGDVAKGIKNFKSGMKEGAEEASISKDESAEEVVAEKVTSDKKDAS
jgi:sec-independent protein translocase protein TatA